MTTHGDDTTSRRAGDDLDPDIRRFVREVSAAWARHPELAASSPAEARRIAEEVRAPWSRGGPRMAVICERGVPVARGHVRIRAYDPGPTGTKPALVYLHGGGWTLFSLDTHDRLMREYAARAGMTVVGVDYALSPEARYPAALEQVCDVVRFLGEKGEGVGVDPTRIVLGGDSAGANLAVAASLRLRDEGRPELVAALLLNYGVFDRRSTAEAVRRFGGPGAMLTSEEMEAFWENYLRSPEDAEDPLVCPVKAELAGLPPALLVVPECDLLAEQSVRLAERMRAAGVPVTLQVYRGASHSFLEAVSIARLADDALRDSAGWLRSTVARRPGRTEGGQ